MPKLKAAVQAMQDEGSVPRERCLNVVINVPGPKRDPKKLLPMTLLAFAGYHKRQEMIHFLIQNHAQLDVKNQFIGTPLLQMLCYARIRDNPQHIDKEIVRFFVDHKDVVLTRVLTAGYIRTSTVLDTCIFLGRLDIVKKMLIPNGIDPIKGGYPGMRPLFVEYVHYPSNEFLKWLFKELVTGVSVPQFIKQIFPVKRGTTHTARKIYGKNPLHAFLLCGSGEVVDALLGLQPRILEEVDPFGKTALHIAAEKGDIESLKILLDKGSDLDAVDEFLMTPLKLATKNEHTKAVEILMGKMERASGSTGAATDSDSLGSMVMWAWALQNSYATYFEAIHKEREREKLLLRKLDNDGNNIAHLAAESGNTIIFKSVIPKIQEPKVYQILLEQNDKGLTPLQVAIMNGNVRILQALQEQRAERKKVADKGYSIERQGDSVEEKDLNELKRENLKLMLFACEHGTVDVVKYFVTELVPPNKGMKREEDKTPLYYAAKAGKHEIVAYLLSINEVSPDSETDSLPPILVASENGHSKCIIHLIEKNANLTVRSECGYNYLMEAIRGGHEDAAKAIILHLQSEENGDKWEATMKVCDSETKTHTPMRLLIQAMPVARERPGNNLLHSHLLVGLSASKELCAYFDFGGSSRTVGVAS
ncbi:Ankyrin-1 [Geodia barretti]|uniref:Ankyrin-1 n=1 Tax=Geodia barretti TaxID=519541 RepID=A0AA35W7F6_GEOBA|nr:Ankyrin-1 [Geodia barretti]